MLISVRLCNVNLIRENMIHAMLVGFLWPDGPALSAEHGSIKNKDTREIDKIFECIYICINDIIQYSSPLSEKTLTLQFFSRFWLLRAPGRGADDGPLYICIYSGGRMEKPVKVTLYNICYFRDNFITFLHFADHFEQFLLFSLSIRSPLEWYTCNVCHHESEIYDICGDTYGRYIALTFIVYIHLHQIYTVWW